MNNKRILFIQNSFSPYRMSLFNHLLQYCDIEVLYLEKFDTNRNWNDRSEQIKYKYYIANHKEFIIFGKKLTFSDIKQFDFNNYDEVIIITNFPNIIDITRIALKLKGNYILWISTWKGHKVFENNKLVDKLLDSWVNFMIKNSKKCIGYSQKSCILAKNKFCLYSSQYYPLEEEYGKITLDDVRILNKRKYKENINIVTISYLSPRKNLEFAIKIINNFSHITLHIIGSGAIEYEKYLKSISNDNIIFHGYKKGKEKLKILRMIDLFLFTTKKDSWGFVINEAMYCGLPVISSQNAMAAMDLIENEKNGFIYKNEIDLKKLLLDISNGKFNLKELSLNAKNTIDFFNDKVIENFKKILC